MNRDTDILWNRHDNVENWQEVYAVQKQIMADLIKRKNGNGLSGLAGIVEDAPIDASVNKTYRACKNENT